MLLRVTQLVEPDGLTLYPMAAGQSDYPEWSRVVGVRVGDGIDSYLATAVAHEVGELIFGGADALR